jgi:hemoglobin
MSIYNSITKESIRAMVDTFYPTILADPITAPPFIEKVGSDINSPQWQKHLELLTNFWAMSALGDLSYSGSPLAPHFSLNLSKEQFDRWLELFAKAIDRVYEPEVGEFFKQRSQNIARNFMINLGI